MLSDNTVGVSTQLLGCAPDQVAMTAMTVLCNPEFEPTETPVSGQSWGTDPRNWHRDIRPDHDAPLSALIDDERANGAAYTQWNIALYDDSILHLIPGESPAPDVRSGERSAASGWRNTVAAGGIAYGPS